MVRPTSDPPSSPLQTTLGEVAIRREGDPGALAVLCMHGVPGSARDFRYLAPLISEQVQVVRIEAPGFGSSPAPRRSENAVLSVTGWAELQHAVAEALGLPRYVLLGHSFGGAAAMLAAASAPGRVAGLVLLASPGSRRHRGYALPSWACAFLARLLSDAPPLRRPLSAFGRFSYRQLGLRPAADWRELYYQMRVVSTLRFERLAACAAAVSCPTLICHCVDDPIVEVGIAEQNARLLRDCQTKIFASGGHYPQKHQAAEVAGAIIELASRLG